MRSPHGLDLFMPVSVSEPLWKAIAAHAKAWDVSVGMALEQILDHVLRDP